MSFSHLKLKVMPGEFRYVLFEAFDSLKKIVPLLSGKEPAALFIADDEASAILPERIDVANSKVVGPWCCIRIIGEMPFGTVQGLIAKISGQLKDAGLGICVISTYKTDWFFVKKDNLETAKNKLLSEGWEFV